MNWTRAARRRMVAYFNWLTSQVHSRFGLSHCREEADALDARLATMEIWHALGDDACLSLGDGADAVLRYRLAYLRIVGPLLEHAESGFVERSWRELDDEELSTFVQMGLARERILARRGSMIARLLREPPAAFRSIVRK